MICGKCQAAITEYPCACGHRPSSSHADARRMHRAPSGTVWPLCRGRSNTCQLPGGIDDLCLYHYHVRLDQQKDLSWDGFLAWLGIHLKRYPPDKYTDSFWSYTSPAVLWDRLSGQRTKHDTPSLSP